MCDGQLHARRSGLVCAGLLMGARQKTDWRLQHWPESAFVYLAAEKERVGWDRERKGGLGWQTEKVTSPAPRIRDEQQWEFFLASIQRRGVFTFIISLYERARVKRNTRCPVHLITMRCDQIRFATPTRGNFYSWTSFVFWIRVSCRRLEWVLVQSSSWASFLNVNFSQQCFWLMWDHLGLMGGAI